MSAFEVFRDLCSMCGFPAALLGVDPTLKNEKGLTAFDLVNRHHSSQSNSEIRFLLEGKLTIKTTHQLHTCIPTAL